MWLPRWLLKLKSCSTIAKPSLKIRGGGGE